ncbi:PREDICTED: uncharacterized protein LOC104612601 [Nelumbo nucifera]|uniref:Uncharacterized protein LOC104612601 n=1 Tax=Nelumbo nucifera TaxID=4432 RepID=A0A1U8BAM8_NELNU|nr:PREDICTED: uncharacterized protein LOC104612601 [Nelumbo nucifera]
MAVISRSSNNWISSVKVLLISTGVVSMAVILKLSVPVVLEFMLTEIPLIWGSLLSWLTPPYLYVVINGIIITIAASSRFHQKVDEQQSETVVPPVKADVRSDFVTTDMYEDVVALKEQVVAAIPELAYETVVMKNPEETHPDFESLEPVAGSGQGQAGAAEVKNPPTPASEENDDFVISRSTWTPQRSDSIEIPNEYSFPAEKPLVSTRFARKAVKASPEGGRALRVAKPKRNDTLESTWKMITDGRPMPLTRHLKKSETWETHDRHNHPGAEELSPAKVKKSETFKGRNPRSSPSPSPGSGKPRKEPSLSQDELNRRVEAFIKKFNEEMRLQRQESLNQYREMINRGT